MSAGNYYPVFIRRDAVCIDFGPFLLQRITRPYAKVNPLIDGTTMLTSDDKQWISQQLERVETKLLTELSKVTTKLL
jgi:hypothetical protein